MHNRPAGKGLRDTCPWRENQEVIFDHTALHTGSKYGILFV